jgi:SAM-dependent methyltransferase
MSLDPYQHHAHAYDIWFTEHQAAYEAELRAVRSLLPVLSQPSIEIGAGTGRFTGPLGITLGVEPVESMGNIAKSRGIQVIRSLAEALPFRDAVVQLVLMVTVLCFVQDIRKALQETLRVLCREGHILIALLDRESPLGAMYAKKKQESLFYKDATLYSVDELVLLLSLSGFSNFTFRQTIFKNPEQITQDEPVLPGYGQGLFAVIHGRKK